MTIRSKVSFLIVYLVFGIVSLLGGGIYFLERKHFLDKMEEARLASLNQFMQAAEDAIVGSDDIALINAIQALTRTPGVRVAFVLDPDGRVKAHSDVSRIGEWINKPRLGPREEWVEAGESFFSVIEQISAGSGRAFETIVIYSRTAMNQTLWELLRHTLRLLLVVGGLVLALGLAAAGFLAHGLTRPIHRLTEATEAVSQGRWGHRIGGHQQDELGRLARHFDSMAEKLADLDRMKNDFVANVTHELRSPLSAIESSVNVMLDDVRSGDTSEHLALLTVVRNNVSRLARFIDTLLDVARIEARRCDVSPVPVRVSDLFFEVVGLFREKARAKSIALEAEAPPPTLTVLAEPDKLNLILCNLLGNALKFTPSGGSVRLSSREASLEDPMIQRGLLKGLRKAPGYTLLSVSDTGPGIPAEDQERIFNRFEQSQRPAQGPRGTGLGLTICRGWAEAHGGNIQVESVVGQGSAFHLLLPQGGPP